MSRKLTGFLGRSIFVFVAVLTLFGETVQAQDALKYFKNYFVTGDYTVGGIGLRGLGQSYNGLPNPQNHPKMKGSFATGSITINGIPCIGGSPVGYVPCFTSTGAPSPGAAPADPIAAFLYWQIDEPNSTVDLSKAIGFFDGKEIFGDLIGDPQNPSCNSTSSPWFARTYRADVLRYLQIDPVNNVRLGNGAHMVSLPDGGTNPGGPFTNGATLVIVYRTLMPGKPKEVPLIGVVIYDGSFSTTKDAGKLDQVIGGFYQAYQNAEATIPTKTTPIVGNGKPTNVSSLNVLTSLGPGTFSKPFVGAAGPQWDNPTFIVKQKTNDSGYSFHVTTAGSVCLTFSSFVTSTRVVDTDFDGLLDVWETKGLHLNPGDATHPATFGGCADYPAEPDNCVNLPLMGANPNTPDVFTEIDWLVAPDHSHKVKVEALNAIGDAFARHNILMHFDVGNNYQDNNYLTQSNTLVPSPYILRTGIKRGGEEIAESSLLCSGLNNAISANIRPGSVLYTLGYGPGGNALPCAYPNEPYPVLSYKRGFRMVKDGFPLANLLPHFDLIRKDVYHYALFAHALATLAKDANGHPLSISGIAEFGGDLMITLGLWLSQNPFDDHVGSVLQQSGTLMHEFGHNFGLAHAGLLRTPNCKPNYQSQMNYLYQVKGLTDNGGFEHLDFSKGLLAGLDEADLKDDPSVLGQLPYRVRYYDLPRFPGETSPLFQCDGKLATTSGIRVESPNLSTIDWNRDGILQQIQPFLDVNFDGQTPPTPGVNNFVDSNDWDSLNLQQISARMNANGLSTGVGSLDIGSLDIGSLDIGSLDIGSLDIGSLDIGSLDIGSLDIGSLDIGSLDIGSLDIGSLDIGEMDFQSGVLSALDPVTANHEPIAINQIDRIVIDFGAPNDAPVDHYEVYRFDDAHPTAILRGVVPGAGTGIFYPDGVKKLIFNDVVNDYEHARGQCPNAATCTNTFYTHYVISVGLDASNHEYKSPKSDNTTRKEVTHAFIVPNNQNAVYGDVAPTPTRQAFGDIVGTLPVITCQYAPYRNVGTYAITCSGANTTSDPKTGITYVPDANAAHYNDGTDHLPGRLTVTPRPITVEAVANRKIYDGNTAATATPVITAGSLAYTDRANFIETYDNKNVGQNKTMTPSGTVVDGANSSDLTFNYTITFVPRNLGIIDPRPITLTAVTNTKVYDGTTSAAALPIITSGTVAAGDTANFIETYDTNNVGTNKTLSPSGSVVDGNGGNNYAVTFVANNTGAITAKSLTPSVTAANKLFDGTTTATITSCTLAVVVAGDVGQVTCSAASASFSDPNLGGNKTVTATGISLAGPRSGNYALTSTTALTTADIQIQLGQVAPAQPNWPASQNCVNCTLFQGQTAQKSPAYAAPSAGRITEWSVQGPTNVCTNCTAKLRIFRPTNVTGQFVTVAEATVQTIDTGLKTFSTNIQVQAGDILGVAFTNGIRWSSGKNGDVIYNVNGDPGPNQLTNGPCGNPATPSCWSSTSSTLANVSVHFTPVP